MAGLPQAAISQVAPQAAKAAPACPADALGTSRDLVLGTQGGFAIGLKTYPQTLNLADHEIVLTFDDGPSPATTPLVLAALAKQRVHATFFLIGRNAAAYPDLVKRELANGHSIGNHTFSHPAFTLRLMSEDAAKADIEKGFRADEKAAYGAGSAANATEARKIRFFRFPGFADTPPLDAWLERQNIGIFGADFWASDWLMLTPEAELQRILDRLERHHRGILLLHDTRRSTALMLPKLLVALKQRGYHIVHLVPGEGPPPNFRRAPKGWTSETNTIIAKLLPRLERMKKAMQKGPTHRPPARTPELPEPRQ